MRLHWARIGVAFLFTLVAHFDCVGAHASSALSPSALDQCPRWPTATTITLPMAIERALCISPKTRGAWATVRENLAALAAARGAYWPTVNATVDYSRDHVSTTVISDPLLNSAFTKNVATATGSLSWLLFDFGTRSGTIEAARAQVLAGQATQAESVQTVFAAIAKDFFNAQVAFAKLDSTRQLEEAANRSLVAARARVDKGVAAITDQLQTETAYAQAEYERGKAENNVTQSLATLAIDLELPPDERLNLRDIGAESLPGVDFESAVGILVDTAVQEHTTVREAQAEVTAATAKVRATKGQGLPTLSAIGQVSYSTQPVAASLGEEEQPARSRNNFVGLQVSVPLLEGFSRNDQIHEAEANLAVKEENLREARQQVRGAVWSSWLTLQSSSANLRSTRDVSRIARAAFDAVEHRYELGVGSVLEVLASQSTLAQAEQQRIEAEFDWRNARVQLAFNLGKLSP